MVFLCSLSDSTHPFYGDFDVLFDGIMPSQPSTSTSESQPPPKGSEGHLFGLWLQFTSYLPDKKPNLFTEEEWTTLQFDKMYGRLVEVVASHPLTLGIHEKLDLYYYVLARYGNDVATRCEYSEHLRERRWHWWSKSVVYAPITHTFAMGLHAKPWHSYRTISLDHHVHTQFAKTKKLNLLADRIQVHIDPKLNLLVTGTKSLFTPLTKVIKTSKPVSYDVVSQMIYLVLVLGRFLPKERPACMSAYMWTSLNRKDAPILNIETIGDTFRIMIRQHQALFYYLQVTQGYRRMLAVPLSDSLKIKCARWLEKINLFENFSVSFFKPLRGGAPFVQFNFTPPQEVISDAKFKNRTPLEKGKMLCQILEKALSLMISPEEFQNNMTGGCLFRTIPKKFDYETAINSAAKDILSKATHAELSDDIVEILN